MTITIGFWIIPALVTLAIAFVAVQMEEGAGMFAGLGCVLLMIPLLFVWLVYFAAKALIGFSC